jgi:hypothetical protein
LSRRSPGGRKRPGGDSPKCFQLATQLNWTQCGPGRGGGRAGPVPGGGGGALAAHIHEVRDQLARARSGLGAGEPAPVPGSPAERAPAPSGPVELTLSGRSMLTDTAALLVRLKGAPSSVPRAWRYRFAKVTEV